MTEFEVYGPFDVPVYYGSAHRTIRTKEGNAFFDSHPEFRERLGCYVFCIRAGGGIKPIYVGESKKSFGQECFGSFQLVKYACCLADCAKGTPVLFLIALPKKKGPKNTGHIEDLERFLIQTGVAANPNLLNVCGTKAAEWSIRGVLRAEKGKPNKSQSDFKKTMKLAKPKANGHRSTTRTNQAAKARTSTAPNRSSPHR